jgi:hypothetical protein
MSNLFHTLVIQKIRNHMARYIVGIPFVLSGMVEEHKMVEYENDETRVAARSHNRQCLKYYPVYS